MNRAGWGATDSRNLIGNLKTQRATNVADKLSLLPDGLGGRIHVQKRSQRVQTLQTHVAHWKMTCVFWEDVRGPAESRSQQIRKCLNF